MVLRCTQCSIWLAGKWGRAAVKRDVELDRRAVEQGFPGLLNQLGSHIDIRCRTRLTDQCAGQGPSNAHSTPSSSNSAASSRHHFTVERTSGSPLASDGLQSRPGDTRRTSGKRANPRSDVTNVAPCSIAKGGQVGIGDVVAPEGKAQAQIGEDPPVPIPRAERPLRRARHTTHRGSSAPYRPESARGRCGGG